MNDAALPHAEARQRIHAAVTRIDGTERVMLRAALGRVLAVDLVATGAVPPHDNAAMDGYAVAAATAAGTLRIAGLSRAGHPHAGPVGPDQCIRILTGATMPAGCDAVIAQEDVTVDGDRIVVRDPVTRGQHRRLAGEDLQRGAVVIERGRRIKPSDLGLAASLGVVALDVRRRLRVAVFSTGSELREPGTPLDAGCIHDSNRYALAGMLERLGIEVIDLGIVDDDPVALEAAVARACTVADAIVTSGGVSAGDLDYLRDVMGRLGDVRFWKLAIKPGRPMAFGRVKHGEHDALLFGLPGNPVATMVVFYALVRDALLAMAGARAEPILTIDAICDMPLAKSPGRTEYVRAIASHAADGWHVRTTGAQGSGILRSMSEANCLVVVEHARGPVAAGERVTAWPFEGLL